MCKDLFVQVTVVIHLKSTLPHQFHDQRRRLFIVLRQGNLVGTLDPLQDHDPSRRNTSFPAYQTGVFGSPISI